MAPLRATRSCRSASTGPVAAFGVALARPDSTARAAASASPGSDLPWGRLTWRVGPVDWWAQTPRRADQGPLRCRTPAGACVLQTLTHPADGSLSGHPRRGRPILGSDRVSESLTATYQAHGSSRWILTADPSLFVPPE